MQRDDAYALIEQGGEAAAEGIPRIDHARLGIGIEIEPGHVVQDQCVVGRQAFRVHQLCGSGLIDHCRRYAVHRLEDRIERGAIERVAAHRDEQLQRRRIADRRHQPVTSGSIGVGGASTSCSVAGSVTSAKTG